MEPIWDILQELCGEKDLQLMSVSKYQKHITCLGLYLLPITIYMIITGPVESIIYADLYRSIQIRLLILIPILINEDLCRSMRINFDQC